MLSKNDKDFLVKEIRKAVREELTVELQWEQVRDEKTGKPLARPIRHDKEMVFLPSFFVQQLMYNEGAFRGMQENLSESISQMSISKEGINALGNLLLGMEQGIMTFIQMSEKIKKQLDYIETKQIEDKDGQSDIR